MTRLKIVAWLIVPHAALFVVFIFEEPRAAGGAQATLSTRIATIRAWIAGAISLEQRELGAIVNKAACLGSGSDPFVDDTRPINVILDRSDSGSEAARLSAEIAAPHVRLASETTGADLIRTADSPARGEDPGAWGPVVRSKSLDRPARAMIVLDDGRAYLPVFGTWTTLRRIALEKSPRCMV